MDTQFLTRSEKNRLYRKTLKDRKRIVVKVGSSSLLHPETGRMDYHKIDILARELSDLKNQGKEVILVSSGATAVGREALLSGPAPPLSAGRPCCPAPISGRFRRTAPLPSSRPALPLDRQG